MRDSRDLQVTAVPDLAAWLREVVAADREFWSKRAADLLPDVEREGEYWYFEARERAARCEAELAILDEHALTWPDGEPEYEQAEEKFVSDDGEVRFLPVRGGQVPPYTCQICGYDNGRSCRTVRLLGSGYRNRAGYDSSWAP